MRRSRFLEIKSHRTYFAERKKINGRFKETVSIKTLCRYIDKRIWKFRNIDLPLKVKRKSHTEKRKQNKRHLVKIPSRSSDAVRVGLEKIAKLYGESFETVFKSITSDNGSEFIDLGEARTKSKIILSLLFPKGKIIG